MKEDSSAEMICADGAEKPENAAEAHATDAPAAEAHAADAPAAEAHVAESPTALLGAPAEEEQRPIMPDSEPVPKSVKTQRRRLIAALACILLASVAVIVYGTVATRRVFDDKTPLAEKLLGEVLGVGVALQGNIYAPPSLDKIPPQTVTEGVPPGAAEHESIPFEPENSLPEAPSGDSFPIVDVDFSVGDAPFVIINETPYEPDANSLFAAESPIPTLGELREEYGKDAPVVLILHTHGTEAYSPHLAEEYADGESFRSLDPESNVVAVGREMKKIFDSHGIGTIHVETLFDAEDYNMAYSLAAEEIKKITDEYPSVKYVLDVHRDAMVTPDGTSLRPISNSTVTVEGVAAAQIMLGVGTDYAGSGHAAWQDNLSVALKLQSAALAFDPDLMRPINLRSASFNQQYTPGSLIVEVGSAANSLSEAKLAGMIFAEAASRVIEGAE